MDTRTSLEIVDNHEIRPDSFQNTAEDDTAHNTNCPTFSKNNMANEFSRISNYCGLRNQGATCYLNSVLQTLFMTQDFRRAVTEFNGHNGKGKESVSHELKKIFECLQSNIGNVTTRGMIKALNIRNVYEEQDAAEYLQKILSEIEPETAMIFQGKMKHLNICLNCHHEHITENPIFSMPIALDSNHVETSVQNNFNAKFEEVIMDGDDQLFCVNCKTKTDIKTSCSISELPEVLTLHLQRFYFDYNYMTYRKNNQPVQIPLRLSAQEECGVRCDYDLYAIVNHIGSLNSGHYYTDIQSFEDQEWYQFNDFIVQRLQNLSDVGSSENSVVSETACLLFFRKQSQSDVKLTCVASHESSSPQTNSRSVEIWMSPDEIHHDCPSAASDEQDLLIHTETETMMENPTEQNCHGTQTLPALFADRTRIGVCIGLIILSLVLVCFLIYIFVFKL